MWEVLRELYYVILEPILVHLGLGTWGGEDPTYGRDAIAYSPMEREAIYENDAVKVTRRRVYLSRGKPVLDTSLTDSIKTVPHKLGECTIDGWINYYIWEMPGVSKPMNADVYLVHGINDYSVGCSLTQGKVMPQALGLMMSGFRTVALDMPGFGRSTGLHAYVPTLLLNTNALDAVMYHVRMWDEVNQLEGLESRKRYAQGSSMGGFTVLYHAAIHPPVASVKQGGPTENRRLALDGVAVSAPMLQIAPESRPNMFIEAIGRLLSVVAGRLPLARAIKGNVSDDPKYVQALTSEWSITRRSTHRSTMDLCELLRGWPLWLG